MNTLEIARLMNYLFRPKSRVRFLGVFASDKIPTLSTIQKFSPCCYIANTDPTGRSGTHWVAVYYPSPRTLEFFDSYGSHPSDLGFHFDKSTHIDFNSDQIQPVFSEVCGHHCIFFLYQRAHGMPMTRIINKFKPMALPLRDRYVQKFIISLSKQMHQ